MPGSAHLALVDSSGLMGAQPPQLATTPTGSPNIPPWAAGVEQLSLLQLLKAIADGQTTQPALDARGEREALGRHPPAAGAPVAVGRKGPRRRRRTPLSPDNAQPDASNDPPLEYTATERRDPAQRNNVATPRRNRGRRAAPASRRRTVHATESARPAEGGSAQPPSLNPSPESLELGLDPRPDLTEDAACWGALFAEAQACEDQLREALHSLRRAGARLYRLPAAAGGRPARLQLAPRLDPRRAAGAWASREEWEAESQDLLAPHRVTLVRLFRAAAERLGPGRDETTAAREPAQPTDSGTRTPPASEQVIPESEAAAAVLSPAGLLLPDRALVTLPSAPPFGAVLEEARRQRIRQVWLTGAFLEALPDPKAWASASLADWKVDPPQLAPWLCARHEGGRVDVDVISPALDPDNNPFHRLADDPDELLRALALFAHLVSIRYRRSTGATGTGLMRALHRGPHAKRLEDPQLPPPALERSSGERDLVWMRPLSQAERARSWVHCFDRNGMYLGACSSLELGFGKPILLQGGELVFEAGRPGYWRARLSGVADPALPPVLERDNRWHWYTTPTLELAREWGVAFELAEAWIWPERSRWLKPWYERLRDARAAVLDDDSPASRAVEAAVKGAYRKSIGWFDGRRTGTGEAWDREGDSMFRPDWRHQVVAKARANLLRFWAKLPADLQPFGTYIDQFYLASDEPDPEAAATGVGIPLGTGLAHFKPHGSVAMPAALAAVDPYLQPKAGRPANPARAIRHLIAEMDDANDP